MHPNPTYSITILAHGTAIKTFRKHLPYWLSHKTKCGMVICPSDNAIQADDSPWPIHCGYAAQHRGPAAIARHVYLLSALVTLGTDYHLIFEYDSLSLIPEMPRQWGFSGIVHANTDPKTFIAPRYSSVPWLLDNESAKLMQAASTRWRAVTEDGCGDRWMAAMAHLAGIPILSYNPPGFSVNTVTPDDVPAMQTAIYSGCTMFHGIKDDWALNTALHFHKRHQE